MQAAKLSYSVKEIVEATGLPRSSVYRHMRQGDLATFKSGRRRMASRSALETFIKNLEKQSGKAA